MKYIYNRDIVLEKFSEREIDRIKYAFLNKGILSNEMPDIFKPKISLKLRDELMKMGSEIFGYKKGRRNVFFVLRNDEIIKEKMGGSVKDFGESYIFEKRADFLITNILKTFNLKEVKLNGDIAYLIKGFAIRHEKGSLMDIDYILGHKLSNMKPKPMGMDDIAFRLKGNIFMGYSPFYTDENNFVLLNICRKELNEKELKTLSDHLNKYPDELEYDEDLFPFS